MILTKKIIETLKADRNLRYEMAIHFNVSTQWVDRIIKDNESDNSMTKISAIEWLCEKTGLTMWEIVEREVSEPIGEHLED